jgi:aspartate/methionine/tyrosine aminotransferase
MSRLPDFRLETYFSRWEFSARHHLTASDAQTMTMAELLDLADDADRRAWETLSLGYTETFGDPALRQAIAGTYRTAEAADVICFAGAEEGLYLAMQVLLGPDDHAVVITPNYQAAETVPRSLCAVSGVALDPGRDWALDLDEVAAAIRPNTRVLSVNFPNNPTGKVIAVEELTRLAELCDERGTHLFSDEVYRGLERDPSRTLPPAADLSERALSLNVTSKSLGLPGLRIGWLTCRDRKLRSPGRLAGPGRWLRGLPPVPRCRRGGSVLHGPRRGGRGAVVAGPPRRTLTAVRDDRDRGRLARLPCRPAGTQSDDANTLVAAEPAQHLSQ